MTGERVAGVVLAAGLSSRMGANKMLLELGGQSLVRRAVSTALSAGLDPVLVVIGHEGERVRSELGDLPCTPVLNTEYATGMNASVRAGISAVPGDAGGAVLLLGDMPLVDASMVQALVEAFRRSKAPLVISTYDGVLAPPIVYSRSLFPELRALTGEVCGKSVVKRHRTKAVELAWPRESLTDLDVPGDLDRVRATLEAA